jgi:hypothetical protein
VAAAAQFVQLGGARCSLLRPPLYQSVHLLRTRPLKNPGSLPNLNSFGMAW